MAEIELTDMPLATAIDLLTSMSTLPITLDPDAMQQLGVTPRDRVSVPSHFGKHGQNPASRRGPATAGRIG